ncbi:MAG: hypothetical protein MUF15_17120 [Acidobacteria bacterium]|jgi:hypothetical protein|nr:hypothetical protein [Acidobacteriota bacterium]
MELNYNVTNRSKKMIESYFFLIRNLPEKDKLALIAKISNSIVHEKKVHKEKGKKTKAEILAETYGCFQSAKSADEIIEEIYNSRHFIDKNHQL